MEQHLSIERSKSKDPSLDFEKLRKEGIDFLQQLTSELWTDYNEHDPGITILEILCYAITDLSFRATSEIPDFISTAALQPHYISPLFSPGKIFRNHPVTTNDYRKLIIDQVDEVANVWLEPSAEIPGSYQIKVELHSRYLDRKEEVARKVSDVMASFRNLCESVSAITILDHQFLKLELEIDIDEKFDVNNVIGELLFEIDKYFSHKPHFYTLQQMQADNIPINEIFDGPYLENGFIKEKQLLPRHIEIHYFKLIYIALKQKGILNVRKFKIVGGKEDRIILAKNHIPRLNTKFATDAVLDQITVRKRDVKFEIDAEEIKRFFFATKATHKRSYFVKENTNNDIIVPKGRKKDFSTYYSIQNLFPGVYGIGKDGLPTRSSMRRKSQAKQLKSYLLFFEQIIANHLKQTENAAHLFSLDNHLDRTYHYQPLQTVPDITNYGLVKGTEFNESVYTSGSERQSLSIVHSVYNKELDQLITSTDPFYERRSRTVNHLMARYGEQFTGNTIEQFNYYYEEKDFRNKVLTTRLEFLRRLPELGCNRYKGSNVNAPVWNTDNESFLEKRIRMLLGIHIDKFHKHIKRSLSEIVFTEKIGFRKGKYLIQEETEIVRPNIFDVPDNEFNSNYSTFETVDSRASHKNATENVSGHPFNSLQPYVMDEDMLFYGFTASNYRFGKINHENQIYIFLKIISNDEKSVPGSVFWRKVAVTATKQDAVKLILDLTNYIRSLNIESEGFHLIEHQLLLQNHQEEASDQIRSEVKEIPRSFFAFTLSFILPDWPARFKDKSFKKVISSVIREHTPAHILTKLIWLNVFEMREFEQLYKNWLTARETNAPGLKELTAELSYLIYRYHQRN